MPSPSAKTKPTPSPAVDVDTAANVDHVARSVDDAARPAGVKGTFAAFLRTHLRRAVNSCGSSGPASRRAAARARHTAIRHAPEQN